MICIGFGIVIEREILFSSYVVYFVFFNKQYNLSVHILD